MTVKLKDCIKYMESIGYQLVTTRNKRYPVYYFKHKTRKGPYGYIDFTLHELRHAFKYGF